MNPEDLGPWIPGLDPYYIPGGELCTICGLTFYNRSMGGPGICPSCDCGNFGLAAIQRQAEEIQRLREELAKRTQSDTATEPK